MDAFWIQVEISKVYNVLIGSDVPRYGRSLGWHARDWQTRGALAQSAFSDEKSVLRHTVSYPVGVSTVRDRFMGASIIDSGGHYIEPSMTVTVL